VVRRVNCRKALAERARWRRSQIAETFASVRVSASSYRFTENVFFVSVVKPELKLVQVERQIFLAHVMVRSDHAAFQQRPKTLDALSVAISAHILASGVPNELMLAIVDADRIVAAPFIRDDQRRMSLGYFADESGQGFGIGTLNYLTDKIPLARDCADYSGLARRDAASAFLAVFPVAILVHAAGERFIHFYDAHQLAEVRVFHSGAQAHAHIPRCLIRAGSKHAMNLQCADSLLARDHQVQNLEPHNQRLLGFLKDGSGRERETVGRARLRSALHTLPVPRTRRTLVNVIVLATWTLWASRPAAQQQVCAACFLIRKQRIELAERHLSHKTRLVLVCFRHASDISANERVSQEPDNPLLVQENETRIGWRRAANAGELRFRAALVGGGYVRGRSSSCPRVSQREAKTSVLIFPSPCEGEDRR
jgi:hypothetical protein